MPGSYMSLSQSMRQKMVMAPQMRQSLELLQTPVMDLRAAVQREIERNPVLAGTETSPDIAGAQDPGGAGSGLESDAGEDTGEPSMGADSELLEYFGQDDYYPYDSASASDVSDAEERRRYFFESQQRGQSLQAYLLEQLEYTEPDGATRAVAEQIIGSIDSSGYMKTPLADIAQATGASLSECERVLHIVQGFDPPGIGARNVGECLLIQLEQAGEGKSLAADIARSCLGMIEQGKTVRQISKACGAEPEEVSAAMARLSELNPKPGLAYGETNAQYVVPEIEVRLEDGRYRAFVDETEVPVPRISRRYLRMLEDPSTPEDVREYVRGKIAAALAFIKGLENRQSTIQRVADEIVERQQDFFEKGASALRPMTMLEVASALGVHETTVSRAVSGKYMLSPQGITELRSFFTAGVNAEGGASVSNTAVKEAMRSLVSGENAAAPYTDLELQKKLKDVYGITVARRTVAKYRESAGILPSHLRRRQ